MAPTPAQRRAIAELQSWLTSDRSEAREGPASPGLLGRMADLQLTEVPLADLRAVDVPDPDVVAGPGATVTVTVRTARCKVTIKDRTNWPGFLVASATARSPTFMSKMKPIVAMTRAIECAPSSSSYSFLPVAMAWTTEIRSSGVQPLSQVKTWRGIRLEETPPGFASKLKVGKVFKDEGFFSSSTKQSKAAQFVQGSKSKVIFVIQGYSGRNVSSLSEIPSEAEILFRPGTRFFIAGKRVVGDVTEISVFEIRQDAAEFVAIWGRGQALIANLKHLIADSQKPATP